MKQKRIIALLLIMMMVLCACSNQTSASPNSSASAPNSSNPSAAAPDGADEIGKHSWQIGHVLTSADDDNYQVFCVRFAENLAELSDGKMQLEVIPNSQLGGERDMIEGMQLGTIEFALLANSNVGVFDSKFMINDLPFIYSNSQMAWDILDGELGRELLDGLETIGVKGLAWGEGGFRQLITKNTSVSTPAELTGLKIRCLENDVYVKTYQTLGASSTPMAWSETFTAVQQGTVDGLDIPISVFASNRYYEIAPYVSMTSHFYSPLLIACSMQVWDSLNETEQQIVMEACIKAGQEERQFTADYEAAIVDEIVAKGAVINEDVDYTAFRDILQPLYDEYAGQIGTDYFNRVMAAVSNWGG